LEAIECICTYEKGKSDTFKTTSLPKRARKGRNALVPILRSGFPRKSTLRSIETYARTMGVHIPRTTLVIVIGLRRTEGRNPVSGPLRKTDIIGIL
jgi:hypothetical protein